MPERRSKVEDRSSKGGRPHGRRPFALRTSTFVLLLVLLAGCRREQGVPVSMETLRAEAGAVQESWNVHFYASEGGRPHLEIVAPYLAEHETPDSTYTLMQTHPDSAAGRVVVYLFDEETGDTSAVVRTDRLYYFDQPRRFVAEGDVRVDARNDRRLESEHLVWEEATRQVTTPRFVRITTPKEHIQGYDLRADEDLQNFDLARITGQVTLPEDGEG